MTSAKEEEATDDEVRSKRQKLYGAGAGAGAGASTESSATAAITSSSTKVVIEGDGSVVKEWVLHIPPRLTKSAYQILLSCNAAPRQWHLEGRFGSRTHVVEKGKINGIPILYDVGVEQMKKLANTHTELEELINTDGVSIVQKEFVQNHRTRQQVPMFDARIHRELEPEGYEIPNIRPICIDAKYSHEVQHSFTYAEMFGGIGGFGVGLEALGGKCVFYSEIDEQCRETYKLNFPETDTSCIHGDIYDVQDSELPRNLDLLVAGFPCQPFSNLGEQPGFQCEKGRGQLFLQIVRVLEISRPKAFLLENVPGLLSMKDTMDVILKAFRCAGYTVYAEVCSAAGLTATVRKRLFFVGIRNDLAKSESESEGTNTSVESSLESSGYQFPYIPDLKLCAQDILDYETLDKSEADILKLSPETFDQLRKSRWKPHHLAWPNKKCDTLTSHYGNAVGRGDSQLVPSASPNPPRRFSVRECARIMAFGNAFKFVSARHDQGEMAYRKQCYRMLGNAVCPPLIAALAGSVLDAIDVQMRDDVDVDIKTKAKGCWAEKGRDVAIKLACQSLRPEPNLPLPAGCLISLQTK